MQAVVYLCRLMFFFFQAEDGIRDDLVTGVQTCALPISPIIIKKKVSHGGHHGGAWKVAYADFVTAMMALFIVLWLMNTSVQIQKVIGGYFKDPTGTSKKVGTNHARSRDTLTLTKKTMNDLTEH